MEIKVKRVNLQQDEVDRLNNTLELKDNTIKYQQDQYMKLLHKLDNKVDFGLNNLLFTYEELITILLNKNHSLYDYISRWFVLDEECRYDNSMFDDPNYNYELCFSEDAIEVEQDAYWLVNVKTDYATTFKDNERLNRKIYELSQEYLNKEEPKC